MNVYRGDPKFVEILHRVFFNFMRRDPAFKNFADVEINREFDLLMSCENVAEYCIANRIGRPSLGTRSMRVGVWMLFENAMNHASFEYEIDGV